VGLYYFHHAFNFFSLVKGIKMQEQTRKYAKPQDITSCGFASL